jgi:hypothetical protein
MSADVDIYIYDGKIILMSQPGGQIWRWAYQRRGRVERLAKVNAPIRSGELARSIEASYEPAAPHDVVMEVAATADYALFVHEGTDGPIFPRESKRLFLPAWGPFRQSFPRYVRGQRAQPFLADALREVMRDL